jgi:hypothetical protein
MKKIKSWIEGPKFYGLEGELKKYCWDNDLQIKIEKTKGFIQETIFFEVSGEDEKVNKFVCDYQNWVKELT